MHLNEKVTMATLSSTHINTPSPLASPPTLPRSYPPTSPTSSPAASPLASPLSRSIRSLVLSCYLFHFFHLLGVVAAATGATGATGAKMTMTVGGITRRMCRMGGVEEMADLTHLASMAPRGNGIPAFQFSTRSTRVTRPIAAFGGVQMRQWNPLGRSILNPLSQSMQSMQSMQSNSPIGDRRQSSRSRPLSQRSMAESLTEMEQIGEAEQQAQSSNANDEVGPLGPFGPVGGMEGVSQGQVLSILAPNGAIGGLSGLREGGLVVVRVGQDEELVDDGAASTTSVTAATSAATSAAAATTVNGSNEINTNNEKNGKNENEETVELAKALFGKPMPKPLEQGLKANAGVVADGDLTGRAVLFRPSPTSSLPELKGLVVAHRHPIAFVLLDPLDSTTDILDSTTTADATHSDSASLAKQYPTCQILNPLPSALSAFSAQSTLSSSASGASITSITSSATIEPNSIPPGSIVDYRGRHLALLSDGSVSQTLPRATTAHSDHGADGGDGGDGGEIDLTTGSGIGIPSLSSISLSVSEDAAASSTASGAIVASTRRPIFTPIPKISEIGLIDSPLVTGITAIDALTPIGKGQNMLIIGPEEGEDMEDRKDTAMDMKKDTAAATMDGKVNKRKWMIHLLKNVIANHHRQISANARPLRPLRCFYGLTTSHPRVKSNLLKLMQEAGIDKDVATVLSARDGGGGGGGGGGTNGTDGIADLDVNGKKMDGTKALEAAEAVAIAAATITLAEHHALTPHAYTHGDISDSSDSGTWGGDSLVIIDDINPHKSLWDTTTQALVQHYGVDAVVQADLDGGSSSEMRGYFSGLIQRAARFSGKKGGGSVTLLLLSTLPSEEDDEEDAGQPHEKEEKEENGQQQEKEDPVFAQEDFDSYPPKIQTRIATLVKAKVPLTSANLRKINIPLPYNLNSLTANGGDGVNGVNGVNNVDRKLNKQRMALQHVEDLISMSDGQIWLDGNLARGSSNASGGSGGRRSPPLDPSRSMTRVGVGADTRTCRADAPALRSVVGSLRFEFQQAMDVMESKRPSKTTTPTAPTALTASTTGDDFQVTRRDAFLLAMHQTPTQYRTLSQECIALLAASRGYLDQVVRDGRNGGNGGNEDHDGQGIVGTREGTEMMDSLLEYVKERVKSIAADGDSLDGERSVIDEIDETLEMSLEGREILEEAIKEYFSR